MQQYQWYCSTGDFDQWIKCVIIHGTVSSDQRPVLFSTWYQVPGTCTTNGHHQHVLWYQEQVLVLCTGSSLWYQVAPGR